MTRLINSYLTNFYRIEEGFIEPNGVIKDLKLIFALSKKQLKYYIKGWVRKQNRGIDFNKCWNEIDVWRVIRTERLLRATWTPEMAYDLHRFHGIDAEAELTRLFIDNIEIEMGRLIDEMREINNNIPNFQL